MSTLDGYDTDVRGSSNAWRAAQFADLDYRPSLIPGHGIWERADGMLLRCQCGYASSGGFTTEDNRRWMARHLSGAAYRIGL